MKNVIGLVVILFCSQISAQVSNYADVSGKPLMLKKFVDVEGSPYIGSGEWSIGVVETIFGESITDKSIRYNGFTDQLEYSNKGQAFFYENRDVKSFEYTVTDETGESETFVFMKGFEYEDDLNTDNYVRVMYNSERIQVIEDFNVIKQKMTPAAYGQEDYYKFVIKSDSYVVVDNVVTKTNLNKRSVLKVFPNQSNEIKKYFKKEGSNFSDSDELADLFNFINSVQ